MTIETSEPPSLLSRLTPREYEVMLRIVQGKLNKLIADELGISQRTIEAHRVKVFRKLNVRNAVMLTRYLMEQGGVQPLPPPATK